MPLEATAGIRCEVCGASADISTPMSWRCPNAADGGQHAPAFVTRTVPFVPGSSDNPFVRFRQLVAWDAFASANGVSIAARDASIAWLDDAVGRVHGVGVHVTPFVRRGALSDELGFSARGGVWVKDETGQCAGSHKIRHLFTVMLHLITAEQLGLTPWKRAEERPALAIASCGNAAVAAATLAHAVGWPIRVFVPEVADPTVISLLRATPSLIVRCPRLAADPPGDPCVHRFREAVAAGAVPFTVQGTENVWCLDGGRTIGWEMAEQLGGARLDRLFVQVGGGALAACAAAGLAAGGQRPTLHVVQTESSAPLVRAWNLRLTGAERTMWPWEDVRASMADGILDDETYDWRPVLAAVAASGGSAVVITEADVAAAAALARARTASCASPTGTAGLAGLMSIRAQVAADENVAVIFSGVDRTAPVPAATCSLDP